MAERGCRLLTNSITSTTWEWTQSGSRQLRVSTPPRLINGPPSDFAENIDVYTPYNYAYHGYWVLDPTQLNPRFGSEADLHALVDAVHARGMYIMVDVVVNNIPSLSTSEYLDSASLQAGGSLWTETDEFHHQCWIDYSNMTSVQQW